MADNCFMALMQGFTGAGLFGRLRRPGAPTEFIDSRSVEEYIESGEFAQTVSMYRNYRTERGAAGEHFGVYMKHESARLRQS